LADVDEYRQRKKEQEPKKELNWWQELTKIKGIGFETAKDLGDIYTDLDSLIADLKDGAAPIRNDKVKLLKEYLIK